MLVRAKKDHKDYGDILRLRKDNLYIIFAVGSRKGFDEYLALNAQYKIEDYSEPDPLFFPADVFELIEDRVSPTWETKDVKIGDEIVTYTSFPEWFQDDFYIAAHDWNLENTQYDIVKHYLKKYQELYSDKIVYS